MKWIGAPAPTPAASGDCQWGLGADILNLDTEFDMLRAAQVCSILEFFGTTSS